jgi:Carboxypeptidase regulatory-like domain
MLRTSAAIAALGGLLGSGLAALPAQAQANARPAAHGGEHRGPSRSPGSPPPIPGSLGSRYAMALALARENWLRSHGRGQTGAGAIGSAGVPALGLEPRIRRLGMLTGVVHGLGGQPLPGVCVTAAGPFGAVTARSRADGRYILAGLRPGNYAMGIRACPGASQQSTGSPTTFLWPGLQTHVELGAGQVETLPPVTAVPAGSAASIAMRSSSASAQAGTGAISGIVSGRGRLLNGICVAAYRVGGGSGRGAVTLKTGKYRITGLQPGRYEMQFTAESGCGNTGNWLDQWYPGITTPFSSPKALAIRVRSGKTKTGIDARMKLGGAIKGTVRSRFGRPLSGICVDAQGRVPGGFVLIWSESGRRGHYALHGVFPGQYTVGFSIGCGNKGNYEPQWWRLRPSRAHATPIKIKGTHIAKHIDAALDPGAAISGTVRAMNSAGKPLSGICVQSSGRHGDSAFAISAKDGTYQLKGLTGGRYFVEFDPSCFGDRSSKYVAQSRRVSVQPAQSLTGVNAYLQLGAGVSGMVTNPHGHSAEGVCVQIAGEHRNAFATTDADGSYTITGLPAGSYQVQFSGGCGNSGSLAPQYYKDEESAGSADVISLAAGTITRGIDAVMKPGATIVGIVTDPSGHRLDRVCVGVVDQSLLFYIGFFNDIEVTSSGRYRVNNLAPGLYEVDFGCLGGGKYADHLFRAKGGVFPSSLLYAPAGVTNGVGAVMRLGGAISGVVRDNARHLISSACLYLVDASTGVQVLASLAQGFVDNGRYKISGLKPATYKVLFDGCGTKYASQWYHSRSTERNADPVRARPGRTASGINAALVVGGTISGLVVARKSGKPVRNVCVEAFDQATQAFGFAETNKTGNYTMRGLATGRYSVSFMPCYAKGPNLAALTRPRLVRMTAPHAVTRINARLAPGGSISGKVTAGAHPQTNICVLFVPTDPAGSFGSAVTGIDGSYTATGLAAGTYHVYFNEPACGFGVPQFAAQWYSGQPTEATATNVTVAAGNTTSDIDAGLQPFGAISGTVTGPTHEPAPGECVTANPAGKGVFGPLPGVIAISTSTGSYSLQDLQPGRYKVKFSAGCGGANFKTQWWKNAGTRAAATVITVGAGALVTGIDAALKQ